MLALMPSIKFSRPPLLYPHGIHQAFAFRIHADRNVQALRVVTGIPHGGVTQKGILYTRPHKRFRIFSGLLIGHTTFQIGTDVLEGNPPLGECRLGTGVTRI